MRQQQIVNYYKSISENKSGEFTERLDPYLLQQKPFLIKEIELLFDFLFQKKYECIVDLGCGTGWYFPILKKHVGAIIGLDISKDLLNLARDLISSHSLRGISVRHYDGKALPFKDASVECIFEWDVMHHVEDINNLLCEVNRVLQKGGTFIGIEPNVFNPLMAIYHLRRKHERKAFFTNRLRMKKLLSERFGEVNTYSNNTAISYNNKYYKALIRLIDPIFRETLFFRLFSLRYLFIAEKTN